MEADDGNWWQTVGQLAAEATRPGWTRLYETTGARRVKLSDMMESKYLKQSDIGDEEVTLTVQGLKKVNMARDDDPPEYKWTVKFEEKDKPMALNTTNLKRMGKALGDDTDDWVGGKIIVYVDPDIEFAGNVVGGLRVKGIPRKVVAKPRAKTDDDINAALNGDDVPF